MPLKSWRSNFGAAPDIHLGKDAFLEKEEEHLEKRKPMKQRIASKSDVLSLAIPESQKSKHMLGVLSYA